MFVFLATAFFKEKIGEFLVKLIALIEVFCPDLEVKTPPESFNTLI